jgi:hypothetical protein
MLDGKITRGSVEAITPLKPLLASEFPRKRRLYLRNLDRLSNYLALLVRRKEGDIRGVASTSDTHDTFDGREHCRIDLPPIAFDVDLEDRVEVGRFQSPPKSLRGFSQSYVTAISTKQHLRR